MESHQMAKDQRKPSYRLTFDDAVEIWIRYWNGEFQNRIAADFDVNSAWINEVIKGTRQPGSREVAIRKYRRSA